MIYIIFCCNLLFYYHNDVRRQLSHFKRSRAAGGYLVTGEAEAIFIGKDEALKSLSASAPIFQTSR